MRFNIRDIFWLTLVCAVVLWSYKQQVKSNETRLANEAEIQRLEARIAQNIINDKRNYQALANNLKFEREEKDRIQGELRAKHQEASLALIEVYNLKEQLKDATKVEQ